MSGDEPAVADQVPDEQRAVQAGAVQRLVVGAEVDAPHRAHVTT